MTTIAARRGARARAMRVDVGVGTTTAPPVLEDEVPNVHTRRAQDRRRRRADCAEGQEGLEDVAVAPADAGAL